MNGRLLSSRGGPDGYTEDGNTVAGVAGGEARCRAGEPEVLPCNTQERDLGDANFIGCVQFANVLAPVWDFQEDVYELECVLNSCISSKFTLGCELVADATISLRTLAN